MIDAPSIIINCKKLGCFNCTYFMQFSNIETKNMTTKCMAGKRFYQKSCNKDASRSVKYIHTIETSCYENYAPTLVLSNKLIEANK